VVILAEVELEMQRDSRGMIRRDVQEEKENQMRAMLQNKLASSLNLTLPTDGLPPI
jgi:hypothetical protein